MPDYLKSFPVVIETPVAWGEMDALQHVNNIIYFRYFESARMAYFEKVNYTEFMKLTGLGPILASTKATFKIPITYPDTVSIGARVSDISDDRFIMEYRVISHKVNLIAALGEGVVVSYNYNDNRKAPIPDEILERIKKIENPKS